MTTDFGQVQACFKEKKAKLPSKRAVLVICENISDLNVIEKAIESRKSSTIFIWKQRGLLLQHGVAQGSMLPLVLNAHRAGLGIVILNPATNTVEVEAPIDAKEAQRKAVLSALIDADMTDVEKPAPKLTLPIAGSETPEAHLAYVFEHKSIWWLQ